MRDRRTIHLGCSRTNSPQKKTLTIILRRKLWLDVMPHLRSGSSIQDAIWILLGAA